MLSERPLLQHAFTPDMDILQAELDREQALERETDRIYWRPLLEDLESLRRQRRNRDLP